MTTFTAMVKTPISNAVFSTVLGLAALFVALISVPAYAQSTQAQVPPPRTSASPSLPGQALDEVVALANNQPILASDMDEQIAQVTQNLRAQGTSLPPENVLRYQVLEHLITQKLELQAAQRKGIQISADQVNNALSSIAARHSLTLAQLPK